MKVTVKAIHFDVSEKLTDFINKKIDKISAHNNEITAAEVSLKVIKPETAMNKEVGVKFVSPEHDELFASKVADSFEEAFDMCLDALKKQLEKKKAKK